MTENIDELQSMLACIIHAPVSIFRIDEAGRIVDANLRACEGLGYTRDELLCLTVFDIDPMMNAERWAEHRKNLKTQGVRTLAGIHRRKDGSTFPVEVNVNYYEFKGVSYSYSFVQDISERKKNEAALRASESRFRTLSEASFEGVAITRMGTFVDLNNRLASMLGYTREELIGCPVIACVAPQDHEKVQQYMLSGSLEPYEHTALRKDGGQFPALIRAQITTIDGEEVRVSVIRDISDQKQAEENYKRLMHLESEALQVAHLGYWEYDVAGGYFIFNDQYYALHGTTAEEAGGYQMAAEEFARKYVHPEDAHMVHKAIQMAMQTDDPTFHFQIEGRILKANGEVVDINVWFRAEKDESGKTVKLFGVNQDITEHKQAEMTLQKSNALLSTIIETAPTPIFGVDLDGKIMTVWNRAAENMLGWRSEEVMGQFLPSVPQENLEEFASFREKIRHGLTLNGVEVQRVRRDGSPVEYRIFASPLRDSEGGIFGNIAVLVDDSEIKRANRALRESEARLRQLNEELESRVKERTAQLESTNKELEAFTFSVSHDLRSPLRGINGFINILMEDYAPLLDEEGNRTCKIIYDEGRRMAQLIDDLLEFSRAGRAEMRKTSFNMNDLVEIVWHKLTGEEDLSRIRFRVDQLANAEADPQLLRQVWVNLLSNALKFTRNRPVAEIEVGSKRERGTIHYWVRDNGAGFDMRYQEKLFGVFQRLHSASEFEGTGVGLGIVQRVVHRHGGEVWAEGKVDEGATFWFSLPA